MKELLGLGMTDIIWSVLPIIFWNIATCLMTFVSMVNQTNGLLYLHPPVKSFCGMPDFYHRICHSV